MQWLVAEHQQLAFARSLGNDTLITLINNSDSAKTLTVPVWQLGLDGDEVLHELLTGDEWECKDGILNITLARKEGLLLIR